MTIRTVTGWFKDADQRRCLVLKWMDAIVASGKYQSEWSKKFWAITLEGLDLMKDDYASVCQLLNQYVLAGSKFFPSFPTFFSLFLKDPKP